MNASERMASLGLNTGPIYGEANEMMSLVKSVIEGQSEEEDNNSFIDVVLKGGVLPGPTGGAVVPPFLMRAVGKKR